jgi:hypothetical protein
MRLQKRWVLRGIVSRGTSRGSVLGVVNGFFEFDHIGALWSARSTRSDTCPQLRNRSSNQQVDGAREVSSVPLDRTTLKDSLSLMTSGRAGVLT